MTRIFTLIFLFFFYFLNSQTVDYNSITTNGMEAGIHSDGTMFMDEEKSNAGFVVDSDEGQATIFSSSIWASGVNETGKILASTTRYGGQGSEPAFVPGPYVESTFDFNKVWKVEGSSISSLIADFADGTVDQQPDESILMWPGRGNPLLTDLPNQSFAPFFDQNADGKYNPMEGDYPIIGSSLVNVIPTQMLYTVYNDSSQDPETSVGMEFHTILYGLECDANDPLQNSIFTSHRIVKREFFSSDLHVSFWTDFDIGCVQDDGLASIPELNAVAGYNIDPIDGDLDGNCQFNINSLTTNPGIQSIVLLNQELISVGSYISIQVSGPPGMHAPVTAPEKYAVMRGFWRDNTPITEEGSGYNLGNTNTTKFIFNGHITDPSEWSMVTADLPSYDNYSILNTEIKTMEVGQEIIIDLGYIYSQNEDLNNVETYNQVTDDITLVQELYDDSFSMTCSTVSSNSNYSYKEISISPNPTIDNLTVNKQYESYIIYNAMGQVVKTNEAQKTIDVIDLLPGMYTIIFQLKEEKSIGRFVKK